MLGGLVHQDLGDPNRRAIQESRRQPLKTATEATRSPSASGTSFRVVLGRACTPFPFAASPTDITGRQGDMLGHSCAVHDLVALTENSVASCGADNLVNHLRSHSFSFHILIHPFTLGHPQVILWKDGNVQSELRNQAASAWIMHQRFACRLSSIVFSMCVASFLLMCGVC